MFRNPHRAAQALGKRSGFEVRVTKELDSLKIPFQYEQHTIRYQQPAKARRHTPDLYFPNGIIVELKGIWDTEDRQKVTWVREQFPDIDYRMVFQSPDRHISPQSKTTYAMICTKLGIPFAKLHIPLEWINEPVNHRSIQALKAATQIV